MGRTNCREGRRGVGGRRAGSCSAGADAATSSAGVGGTARGEGRAGRGRVPGGGRPSAPLMPGPGVAAMPGGAAAGEARRGLAALCTAAAGAPRALRGSAGGSGPAGWYRGPPVPVSGGDRGAKAPAALCRAGLQGNPRRVSATSGGRCRPGLGTASCRVPAQPRVERQPAPERSLGRQRFCRGALG